MMYDAAIIGGGVIGGFCARELTRYNLSVVILEAADDVAAGASRANSGIVHAGFDAAEGTLKARFNVLGNRMMPEICRELGVGYKNNGSLVVAFGKEQENTLRELRSRGEKNGVEGLEILSGEQARAKEPHLSERVT
ncbi:MAG TPA: FAD-dependent oxidoreductase, partial [Candidatus Borkfalkia excrementavium]|nr:FAD-dependent oxidoreductase [Candidatus Borkfalkia excrementavium]